MKLFLLVGLIFLLIVLGPVLTIWSLNTLFPVLAIPYTIETWFAALLLAGVFSHTVKGSK